MFGRGEEALPHNCLATPSLFPTTTTQERMMNRPLLETADALPFFAGLLIVGLGSMAFWALRTEDPWDRYTSLLEAEGWHVGPAATAIEPVAGEDIHCRIVAKDTRSLPICIRVFTSADEAAHARVGGLRGNLAISFPPTIDPDTLNELVGLLP